MENFKYALTPSNLRNGYQECPSCGHRRFTQYIDTETGEIIDDDVGRCERINSCGYHYTPRQYFEKQNLKHKNNNTMQKNSINSNITTTEVSLDGSNAVANTKPEIDYIHRESIDSYRWVAPFIFSALYTYLTGFFASEKVREIFELYRVKGSRYYQSKGSAATLFVYTDADGVVRQVKEMAYDPETGRRVREGQEYLVYDKSLKRHRIESVVVPIRHLAKWLMYQFNFQNRPCLFGEHILHLFAQKPVNVVESEKAALIGSLFDNSSIWLATGGVHGCQLDSLRVAKLLEGRQVTLFPDLNVTEEWEAIARTMSYNGVDVGICSLEDAPYVTQEDRLNSADIGDFYLRHVEQNGLKPTAQPPIQVSEIKKVDASSFGLSLAPIVSTEPTAAEITVEEMSMDDLDESV